MLEASELMVFYENMLALNNVSLRVDERKIVGIFGSNSAGKSTLMYALSGIHSRYSEEREDEAGAKGSPSLGASSWTERK